MKKKNSTHELVIFSLLFLCVMMLLMKMVVSQNTTKIQVNVGVVLDMDTWPGQMGLSCISMALSDFYASHESYKTRLVLHTRDSKNDTVGAAAAALDLITNVEVQAIFGPLTSMQADFLIDLGDRAQVPIITFSATSPSLSAIKSPYFFRTALNDSSQVQAISSIVKAFGWREVIPIYVDNEFGEGVLPFLTDALQETDTRVTYRSVIPPSATDYQIEQELHKLMTMQTRVFIVHMSPPLGSRLFKKAKQIGMMSKGYVWIVTDGIGNFLSSMDPLTIDSMQGLLGIKTYVPQSKMYEAFRLRWKSKFQEQNQTILDAKLNIFGLWAYDAAIALAMAAEKVNVTNFSFQKNNILGNFTDFETFGISRTGPNLSQALSNSKFKGLSGEFHFVNGQLQSSAFQIITVFGNKEKGIGFWTPRNGISKKLNFNNTSSYSTSKESLGVMSWPGETTDVPKGWVIPTKGKRLKIGVPVKKGENEFVRVTRDPSSNITIVTGYCIDVFKAVMEALPYDVPYDFIPYMLPNGSSAGTYNDLIYQVYLQNYDAAVGDITIVANRSFYVDFTLPYSESGVSMIVPVKDYKNKSVWIFLKPLTWDLWVTSACSFVFIGFVIWVLEHRINEDFRGPPSHQVGTILWFSFSTMVFAHKEKVVSNLARFVVIVWLFVVLILTQSYTASLTSILTVKQLQPTTTDVNELLKRGEYVGCSRLSFVYGLLKKMKFEESKIRVYSSPEGCAEALSKGSANGGIAAAFDETPYMKPLLRQHCSKYAMVGPVYKTDGFGFVFPRGSPLVPDISRAILTVTQGDVMTGIEKEWFGKQTSCPDSSSSISSNNLGPDSFRGLFLIAGVASISAFLIYAAMFLYEHRHVLMPLDPNPDPSIWRKTKRVLRRFDHKDFSSHTFKNSPLRDRNVIDHDVIDCLGAVEGSRQCTNCPPSPSSDSIQTDSNFVFCGGQGSLRSSEYGEPNPNRVLTPQETSVGSFEPRTTPELVN